MRKMFKTNLIFFLFILIIAVIFAVAEAKVVTSQGTGEVESVEPQYKSITLEIDHVIYSFTTNKDTVFKGLKGLKDIKKDDNVFVKYTIDEHGRKFLISLEKKASN